MGSLVLVVSLVGGGAWAQVLKTRPPEPERTSEIAEPALSSSTSIPLTVPSGTPIKVSLDREIRIRKVGQPVHGKVAEPVYAFDQLVIPAGSEALGKVAAVDPVSKKTRVLAGLNANFSPAHRVQVDFDELVLANGKHVPIHVAVSPASGGALQLVSAEERKKESKFDQGKAEASSKAHQALREVEQEWAGLKQRLHEPEKAHKLEHYAITQLPYHPQYMEPGWSFNAELKEPLDFGSEFPNSERLSSIGAPPPSGSVVHAVLVSPLSSATSRKGDPVDAVITQPLVVSDKLFIPQGSHLKGIVLQVRPARWLNRSGQLRIVFHELVPPNGIQQKLEASLEGVEVASREHLTLDAEGGAQNTAPRSRYLTTALSIALATSGGSDADRGRVRPDNGNVASGAANGASGFKLVGTLVGAFAHSRAVTSGLGVYGAATSVFGHFVARGRDVEYPKDMAMVVGFGANRSATRASCGGSARDSAATSCK
jgi:hypothetical protein